MAASVPPQSLLKPPLSLPQSSAPTTTHRLPSPLRRSRPATLHSSPAVDWPWEQRLQESLSILDLMESQSLTPDPTIFCTLLKGAADARSPRFARLIHDRMLRYGLQADPIVANNLLLTYSRCGQLGVARRLFDEMPVKTVSSWTTAISMYHHAGFPHDALDLYRSMSVKPNAFTHTIALTACASVGDLELGTRIHKAITEDGCSEDEFIRVALINMYVKCGRVSDARKVFDGIGSPSVEAFTAMVEGYSVSGEGQEAMCLVRTALQSGKDAEELGFAAIIRPCGMELALRAGQEVHAHMVKFGRKPGMKTLHCLIDLYEKCDKVRDAHRLFDELMAKDVQLWARMISGYVRSGLFVDALKVYVDMTYSDTRLNPNALCSAIKACAGILGLEEGRQIHGQVIKVRKLVSKDTVLGGIAELYRSCGEDEAASKLMKQQSSLTMQWKDTKSMKHD